MRIFRRPGIAAGALVLVATLAGCTAPSGHSLPVSPPSSPPSATQTGATPTSATPPSATQGAAAETVDLVITGGHDTDPVDDGRPVVLIAAALGVPAEVFREAFSGVHPAGVGTEVDEGRATANKAVLLAVLGPYGVTNDRLDEVSDFYRYAESAGESWSHRDATATATIRDGVVRSITVTDPGFGYSSTPTVELPTGQRVVVELAYGTDLATNGSVAALTLE